MIPHSLTQQDYQRIADGYDQNPAAAMSLKAEAYTDPAWFALEQNAIFAKSWQWVCHVEKVRDPGQYVTATIAGRSIVVLRDREYPLFCHFVQTSLRLGNLHTFLTCWF